MASTSRMRGTFSRTHASAVSRQAARIGSAAFLLPSTVTTPAERAAALHDQRRHQPNSPTRTISSSSSTPKRVATASRISRSGVATSRALAPPSLTTKFACTGETRAAPHAAPLSPAASTRAPAEARHALRAARTRVRVGVLEDAARARQRQRLGALAKRERAPRLRRAAPPGRPARRGSRPRARPRGCAAAGSGRSRTPSRRPGPRARRRRGRHAHRDHDLGDDLPLEVGVAVDGAADRARRARPRREAGEAVADRVAHQAVHGDAGLGPDAVGRGRRDGAAVPAHHQAAHAQVADEQVRTAPEPLTRRRPPVSRAAASPAPRRRCEPRPGDRPGPPMRSVVNGASGAFVRTRSGPSRAPRAAARSTRRCYRRRPSAAEARLDQA